ncbi:hypothetical protein ABZ816_01955 [Actinosynnema sp. NPDC047251]|uniref:hypothetical protein n=1 Tax=Saccharothrix espanaensis TaxID=103731 RepID=UPI0015686894|nr:hypothetical protein [Saccharothrix espanaensis]
MSTSPTSSSRVWRTSAASRDNVPSANTTSPLTKVATTLNTTSRWSRASTSCATPTLTTTPVNVVHAAHGRSTGSADPARNPGRLTHAAPSTGSGRYTSAACTSSAVRLSGAGRAGRPG